MNTAKGEPDTSPTNDEVYGLDSVEPAGDQRMPVPVSSQPTISIAVPDELDRVARRVHRVPTVQAELAKVAEEEARREAKREGLLREHSFQLRARTFLKGREAESALRDGLVLKAFDDGIQILRPQLQSGRSKEAFDTRINEAMQAFSKCDDMDDEVAMRALREIQVEHLDSTTAPIPAWYGLREIVERVPTWGWGLVIVAMLVLLILVV